MRASGFLRPQRATDSTPYAKPNRSGIHVQWQAGGVIWLRAAALVIISLTAIFLAVIVSALVQGLNIECGCFGTVGGKHIGLLNLALAATLLSLAILLARRSQDCPANIIFGEAGAQNSAPPLEVSL